MKRKNLKRSKFTNFVNNAQETLDTNPTCNELYNYEDDMGNSIDDIKIPFTALETSIDEPLKNNKFKMKANTNEYQKNINLIHSTENSTTPHVEEGIFEIDDEEYSSDKKIENYNNDLKDKDKSLLVNFKLPNALTGGKKEIKNTSKPIEKTVYTLPVLNANQTYRQEKDIFDNFDFTDCESISEDDKKKIKIEDDGEEIGSKDDEIDIDSIKPPHTSNPIQFAKKEQENLQSTFDSLVVTGTSIKLLDNYIQQGKL